MARIFSLRLASLAESPRLIGCLRHVCAHLEVWTYGSSSPLTAYAFAGAQEDAAPLVPSLRYWRLLRNGARRHGLERPYRDFLSSYPRLFRLIN